jgi:hypothetical protein
MRVLTSDGPASRTCAGAARTLRMFISWTISQVARCIELVKEQDSLRANIDLVGDCSDRLQRRSVCVTNSRSIHIGSAADVGHAVCHMAGARRSAHRVQHAADEAEEGGEDGRGARGMH